MAFDFNSKPRESEGNEGFWDDMGFEPSRPSGFKKRPKMKKRSSDESYQSPDLFPFENYESYPETSMQKRIRKQRGKINLPDVSGGNLFLIILVLLVVVLCFIFWDEITAFLIELLSWVIIILIVFFVFKWLIFGGRRR